MAGNFSFGDYFKEGAIDLAWSLLTGSVDEGGYGLPEDRLWTTVYLDDDEALELWKRYVPESRIQRRDKADNYWHMGVPGPGGPCSEIYYDRGSEHGREGGPIADEDRYLEVWNLVFMQYQLVRGAHEGRLRHRRPAARAEHRHRHGPGARRHRPAGRRQPVRDRHLPRDPRPRGRPGRRDVRRLRRGRRAAARRRRPRPHRRDAHRRRRARPATRARDYVLRRILRRTVRSMRLLGARRPDDGRAGRGLDRRDGPAVPRAGAGRLAHRVGRRRRGGQLPRDAHQGRDRLRQRRPGGARSPAACCPARRPSRCTTPTASRSTSPSRWPPSRGSRSTRRASATLMAEQRTRAKADAKAKKTGGADTRRLPRAARGRRLHRLHRLRRGAVRGGRPRAARRRRGRLRGRRGRRWSTSCWTARRSTPRPAASSPTQGRLVLADGTELVVTDVQKALPGLTVHQARVRVRRGAGRHPGARRRSTSSGAGRSRAPTPRPTWCTPAFRAALGEQATQAGSREPRPAGSASTSPRPRRVPGVGARRRRAGDQRDRPGRPRGPRLRHHPGRGPPARRHGAVRREVRRRGARRRGRRLRPRALRRHARRPLRPARHGQAAVGGLHRLRRAARRGPGRPGRLLLPRPRARAAGPAGRRRSRCRSTRSPTASRPPSRGCARSRRSSPGCAPGRSCSRPGRSPRAPATSRRGVRRGRGPRRHARRPGPLARARRPRPHPGRPAAAVVLVAAGGERVTLVAAVNDAGRARGLSANALLREAAAAVDGKGGGKDDVAQGGGTQRRRDRGRAEPGRGADRRVASGGWPRLREPRSGLSLLVAPSAYATLVALSVAPGCARLVRRSRRARP